MNREIVLKALQKAQARGLDPSATVDLIQDYLEIAGDIGPVTHVKDSVVSISSKAQTETATPIEADPEYDDGYIELAASARKALKTPPKEWIAEDLFNEICKHDWSFDALPEGFKEPLSYRGTPVINPRGMPGVGVIFSCIEVTNPKELPLFFPLSDLKINPQERMDEVKRSIESLLRVRKTPVPVNFSKITSPPAMPSFEPDADGVAVGGVI